MADKLSVQNVIKIGLKLTKESAKFIHPGQWISCESDYREITPGRSTWVLLCNVMLKHIGFSHSSDILGSDSSQSNNRSLTEGNSILATVAEIL